MKGSFAIVYALSAVIVSGPIAHGHSTTNGGTGKRVIVDKTNQELRAYEGDALVFRTNISTGRRGRETPNGRFRAQGKYLMHYSTLYDNAPMPYSVQVNSNYFIHGFSYVPSWPASHGCIRLPVGAAREFYDWVKPGTRINIVGHWQGSYGPDTPPAVAEKPKRPGFFARLFGRHSAPPAAQPAPPANGAYSTDGRGTRFQNTSFSP